ncbi:MAG TPA: hypothetical protein VF189_02235 [Patescibacteria group bacterium]
MAREFFFARFGKQFLHKKISNKLFFCLSALVFLIFLLVGTTKIAYQLSEFGFISKNFYYKTQGLIYVVSNYINDLTYKPLPTIHPTYPQEKKTQKLASDRFFIYAGGFELRQTPERDILKPKLSNGRYTILLDQSMLGMTAELPVGTIIFLSLPQDMVIIPDSMTGVIEPAQGKFNAPNGVTNILQVVKSGNAEIIVKEKLNNKLYISNKLGISFYYAPFIPIPGSVENGEYNFVREIGNKIYLYSSYDPDKFNKPFKGTDQEFLNDKSIGYKYLEVFYKNPQESLSDAIKEKIFNNNLPNQCYIKTNTIDTEVREDMSYERAEILEYETPTTMKYTYQQNRDYILSCTSYAGNYIGESYFMINPQHPDRFLYISLGQDNVASGYKGYTWDGTIKIF